MRPGALEVPMPHRLAGAPPERAATSIDAGVASAVWEVLSKHLSLLQSYSINFYIAHLRMPSQQPATTSPAVRHLERINGNPRVKVGFVSPARDHHYLIRSLGAQDLYGDEAGEILYVPAACGETVYDLVCRAFFHGEAVEDRDHSYVQTLSGRLQCRCRRRVWPC